MNRTFAAAAAAALAMSAQSGALASEYLWRDHALPYSFTFGNHFDTHQQTRETQDGGLQGFLYVRRTGETTADGLAVATHADCRAMAGCEVGWLLDGRPATGRFLYHVMGDLPVWQLPRAAVPQPGAHSHFHWVGDDPVTTGAVRDGYLLQLRAVQRFCFVHHGMPIDDRANCVEAGGVPVSPGLDIATHQNTVASFPHGAGH